MKIDDMKLIYPKDFLLNHIWYNLIQKIEFS